jgi:signal transduction histidine kinase
MAPSEGGALNPIDLAPLLHDLVAIHAPAAAEHNVKIVLDCPEELPPILGDRGQLVQLFVNLIRNGVEAMANAGTLTIHAHKSSDHPSVIVDVMDEGVGIDAALRAKIFEPFFTTKASGTGLGLSICREIADFHRARLSLKPRSEQTGTVARVEFSVIAKDGSTGMTQLPRPPRDVRPSWP